MAKGDIMPYRGADQGSVLPPTDEFPLKASETFVQGEPVSLNNAGDLTESASAPADEDFLGIAAMSGDTVGATDPNGIFRSPEGLFTPGASPNLPVAGDLISIWRAKPGHKWVSRNFATDGAGTAAVPTKANAVGEVASLILASGNWFVDVGGSGSRVARIDKVLDAKGNDIARSSGTGVFVVFEFIATQSTSIDAPAA